jgi:nicotinamide riboside transporter PnuC
LRWRPRRPLLVATVAMAMSVWPLLALAFVAPLLVISFGTFFAFMGGTIFGILWNTTMQREIPREVLSRVSAYDWFGSLVFLPIGLALIGPISKAIGTQTTFVGAAVLLVAMVLATLCVPSVTQMRTPSEVRAPAH